MSKALEAALQAVARMKADGAVDLVLWRRELEALRKAIMALTIAAPISEAKAEFWPF